MIASSRLIPNAEATSAVSFTLLTDGDDLGPSVPLLSAVVDREVNRIPTATFILEDGSLADQTFPLSESGKFDFGKEIELKLGYQGTNETVFNGMITGQRIKLRGDKSLLVVTCKDKAFRMTINRQTRYFEDVSDAEAAEEIINEYGLEANVATSTDVAHELTQHLATDWDFLVSRAEANGQVVIVTDGEVAVVEPELGPTPSLTLEYGANVIRFDAEVDARRQHATIESFAWIAADDEVVTEDNGAGLPAGGEYSTAELEGVHEQQPLKQVHGGGVPVKELMNWSAATARFSELGRVRGTIAFQGTAALALGGTVLLDKLGAVYNGKVYVSGLRHELSAGNWTTTAQIGLNPERFTERFPVSAPAAGGLLPAVSGLHIGLVVQMHDDPQGEERIQVTLPATAPEGAGNWARLAVGLGGGDAGLTFRPAVGDEVIVGFLNDDPRYPVILGGLHTSGRPAPFPPSEDNELTGYVSRGGNRLEFNDLEESIVLKTISGDTISMLGKDGTLNLEDQHGNKIEMSSGGIVIESIGELTLKANSALKTDSATLEMKASATGKIEASATLGLKGGMVNIN